MDGNEGSFWACLKKSSASAPLSLHIMHERPSLPQFKRSNRTWEKKRVYVLHILMVADRQVLFVKHATSATTMHQAPT